MDKYKKVSITLLIISMIFIILGGTLALWTWNSTENKNIVFNTASNLQDYIIYDEGESKFVGDFQVSDSYLDGVHTTISLYKTEEVSNVNLYATINMDINSIGDNLKSLPGLKWVVTSGNSTDSNHEVLSQGNFLGTNDGDTLVLYNNIEVLTTKKEFTIWLWLDSSTNLDSELTGETIDTSIWTQIDQIIEDRYEITNISVYNKIISATVVNSTANIMYYQVTTSNIEPTEWIEIPEEDIGNIYALEYNSLNVGTNYVWFKDSNNKIISKDIYVYETYTITYLDVGETSFSGIHEEGYPETYNTGNITYLDMPTKEGYSFSGYYLNNDGSGDAITSISDSQTGDITLYAKWIDNILPVGDITLLIDNNAINVEVSASDSGSGIKNYGYLIQTSSVCPTDGYTASNNSNYIFNVSYYGTYYVCVKVVDNAENSVILSDSINFTSSLNGADPVLDEGMIPITFDVSGDNIVIKTISKDDSSWYDYDNKEWANAILVTESSRSKYLNTTGVEVNQSDILAYFVWIPRYKYKIWTLSESSTGEEQEIEIVFQSKNEISTGTQVGEYITHPSFWWDDDSDGVREDGEELSGIWVGKFETTGSSTAPTILPDVTSLRSQIVSAQFQTALKFAGGTLSGSNVIFTGSLVYGLTTDTDSHMMKNSEWGAVAYLSHSKYGVNREIYINNSSGFYTGRSGGNVGGSTPINGTYSGQSSTTQYNTYGFYTWDGYLLNYNTNTKSTTRDMTKVASTTGNITGIYDMSGGAYDSVMGNYNNTIASSGFSTFPKSKYYDKYTTTSSLTACNGGLCLGHSLFETKYWYGDSADPPDYYWYGRGGVYDYVDRAGIFNSSVFSGNINNRIAFRMVLIL